jgi:malate dehydrogenase
VVEDNLGIVADIARWFRQTTPSPTVVVTNPVDVITYELYRQSGWPSRYFLGYSLSETARLVYALGDEYDVQYKEVSCPVLGEHGEYIVPVFSRAKIRGESIDLDAGDRKELLDYVRGIPYTVMKLRGASESSRWVTGQGVALVTQQILEGGIREPIGLSTPLNGEYGYSDIALSVPLTLDEAGVKNILEWDLDPWEQSRMDEAYQRVATNIPE